MKVVRIFVVMGFFVLLLVVGVFSLFTYFNENPEYYFDGKINKEQVEFYERSLNQIHILEVIKTNGVHVKYVTYTRFVVNSVEITVDGVTTRYENDSAGDKVLVKAQVQFDDYLEKILDAKAKVLEDRQKKGLIALGGEVPE